MYSIPFSFMPTEAPSGVRNLSSAFFLALEALLLEFAWLGSFWDRTDFGMEGKTEAKGCKYPSVNSEA